MREVYNGIVGAMPYNTKTPYYVFAAPSSIETGHLQHSDSVYSYQSKAYAFIGMDEATQYEDSQIWYMRSRMRSMTGIRSRMALTCNPDPDSLVRELVDYWIDEDGYPKYHLSGHMRYYYRVNEDLDWDDDPEELRHRHRHHRVAQEAPTSLTFIPARLEDNPALLEADPTYVARLEELPRVERERLRYGNWNIRPSAGDYFNPTMFEILDTPIHQRQIVSEVRAWDIAATSPSTKNPDPDWTRGVRMALLTDGKIVIRDMVSRRDGPHEVDRVIVNVASHDSRDVNIALWQDPGAAGVADVAHKTQLLSGYHVVSESASKSKTTYAGPVSTAASRGEILIERGDWNAELLDELHLFPDGRHDDIVDAISRGYRYLTGGITKTPTPITGGSYKSKGLLGGRTRGMWR
jgi:predicted phage terminase large subunit-like protein